jgi:hypothetical protein
MSVRIRIRMIGALFAATALSVGAMAAPSAQAAAKPPVRPGPVTGLTMNLTKPADNFTVQAVWNPATLATSYVASLTDASTGAVLATNSVSVTNWSASLPLTGVTQVRLTVTPYANKFSGPAQTVTQAVPDLTAPNGTFAVSWVDRLGTITQTSLSDDGPIGSVTKTVNWGDNTPAVAWNNNNPISHTYAADGLYRPTVTLKDGVGNTRVIQLAAIVPGDKTAPVGTFTTSPGHAWLNLTPVNLTQTSLSDDFSPASYVQRFVDWGDGTAVQTWTDTISITHVYALTGSYAPFVVLKDEAGNTRQVNAPAVSIERDAVAPVVKLLPPKKNTDEVGSWKKLLGQATDEKGTGVMSVSVWAIEKRTKGWYFYKAAAKTWVKATTKAKAWKRAKAAVTTVNQKNEWSVRLSGLRQGTLFYKTSATDLAANASKPVLKKAVLTAP